MLGIWRNLWADGDDLGAARELLHPQPAGDRRVDPDALMRALVYDAPREFAVQEVPRPRAGVGEVVVDVELAGRLRHRPAPACGRVLRRVPADPGARERGCRARGGLRRTSSRARPAGGSRQRLGVRALPAVLEGPAPLLRELPVPGCERAGRLRRVLGQPGAQGLPGRGPDRRRRRFRRAARVRGARDGRARPAPRCRRVDDRVRHHRSPARAAARPRWSRPA